MNKLMIRKELNSKLYQDMDGHKIIYVSAPTGWGKTVVISDYLREFELLFSFVNTSNQDLILDELKGLHKDETRPHVFVFDDFHKVTNRSVRNEIIEFISKTDAFHKFIFLSRAEATVEFSPFIITRQLKKYYAEEFRFTKEECTLFLKLNNIEVNEKLLEFASVNCKGYPISLNSLISNLKRNSGELTQNTINQLKKDLFDYYDMALFESWPEQIQEFMMSIVCLDEFTLLLAQMVTLKSNVKEMIEQCLFMGGFLIFSPPETYKVHHFFRQYLLNKQKELLTDEDVKKIYHSAGNYYEMTENQTLQALKYYKLAEENEKVKDILMRESVFGPCKNNLMDLEPYYLMLKKEEIANSPILCSGMSMLYSLKGEVKESEYWLHTLSDLSKRLPKKSSDYRSAEEQIAYLSIGLPHAGSKGIISNLGKIAKQFKINGLKMQDMSITGNMPSLMHGGKDFCDWSKNAEPLRKMLNGFFESIFVKDGPGMADIGVGEVYYEQDKLDLALIELTKGTTESRQRGSLEMHFVGTAILAKLLIAKGEFESAEHVMEGIYEPIIESSPHLLSNYQALRIRMKLLQGKNEEIVSWYEREAPDENLRFYTIERYRYITKIRIYLMLEKYTQAEILLERLKRYYVEYKRSYDYMECLILQAIIYYHKSDLKWQEKLHEVLQKAEGYQFVRIFADEGRMIQPLLQTLQEEKLVNVKAPYWNKIMKATKKQAILYPNQNVGIESTDFVLTKTELDVLSLLIAGKKYREIETIMNISSNTVKFHIKNLYRKLEVTSKSEAISKAQKINLV